MSLLETVQFLGNIGEFLGAIAVLATLAYLVIQTKQNSKLLQSSVQASWLSGRSDGLRLMADHADRFAKIYSNPDRRLRDLDPGDRLLHSALFTHNMNFMEQAYLQHLQGTIDDDLLENNRRQAVASFKGNTLFRSSWRATRSFAFDTRFVDYVDENVLREVEELDTGV